MSALYDPTKDGVGLPTALTAALTDVAVSCTVAATTNAPATGLLLIDSELIKYTGKTATTFTGLTRGFRGTTAAAHAVAASVTYGADPWTITGDLPATSAPSITAGERHAVVLKDGRVLIAGGYGAGPNPSNASYVFNPATLTWATSGVMVAASANCDMVVLKDGRVLLVGGLSVGDPTNTNAVKNCQIWTAGVWSAPAGAQMPAISDDFLDDQSGGGGVDGTIGGAAPNMTLAVVDGAFSAADVGRSITLKNATTPANNGTFPITAVADATHLTYTNAAGVAEAYVGRWNIDDGGRFFLRVHMLPDGRVLAAGGFSNPGANDTANGYARKSAVAFDPLSDTWGQVGNMPYGAGFQYSGRQKTGGGVFYAGGDQGGGAFALAAAVFDPIDDVFTSIRPLNGVDFGGGFFFPQVVPIFGMVNVMSSGEFMIFGGVFDFTTFMLGSQLVQLYTPGLPSTAYTLKKSSYTKAQADAAWATAKAQIPAAFQWD
jgi:hypothetical protein